MCTEIIVEGLLSSKVNDWAPSESNLADDITRFVKEQTEIGWQHIYYGRFAKSMSNISKDDDDEVKIGDRWTKRIIITIWTTLLQLWSNQNGIIYNAHTTIMLEQKRERLTARVQECYNQRYTIKINDQAKIFYKDQEQLMHGRRSKIH